ncbi:hypothetical protein DNTS_018849 [Danionella cerebrum]|uniref:Fork-head domain-containing protein n=1 Tax=Danionella cerebrum TaxID=2873325 RepID=A0A553MS05_9TELE|nr:hypothetical protein DNTS_018849 [Danionella translucida]
MAETFAVENSIRHNLSLHTRFIRVQNEGTGKSSWWMLNPDGGKAGKPQRRRAISMDNGTKPLKSKGRISTKKKGGKTEPSTEMVLGFCSSPEAGKCRAFVREETWTDLHSLGSSSASTLSGRLSPILAEGEFGEAEEGRISCSTSPQLFPSRSNAPSPASHCPTDLRASVSFQQNQSPSHKNPHYHYTRDIKDPETICETVYSHDVGLPHLHSSIQTTEENSSSMQFYKGTNTLQSLTTGQDYLVKDMMLNKENDIHAMMIAQCSVEGSRSLHHNIDSPSSKPFHSHDIIESLNQDPQPLSSHSQSNAGHMQSYMQKPPYLYCPPVSALLPSSTTLPPNPSGLQGISEDSCQPATSPYSHSHPYAYTDPQVHNMTYGLQRQPQGTGTQGYHNYHHHHHHHNQLYQHDRLQTDVDMDAFYSSLDCDMESILLQDITDSGEEINYNYDSSLTQGIGMGFGLGGKNYNHIKQSWVPG